MTDLTHNAALYWSNGEGCTTCTTAYRDAQNELDELYKCGLSEGSINDLDPETYQAWMALDHKLSEMRAAGHVGRGERW